MVVSELVKKARTYRRFDESFSLSYATLRPVLNNLRYISSARNAQPLRYILSLNRQMNSRIFTTLRWAGYLKDWDGPGEGERPVAYLVVMADRTISQDNFVYFDAGIAIQTVMLQLAELELGGCTIAAIDKSALREILQIDERFEILCVIAMGKPKEKVVIVDVKNGDIRYYRDEEGTHYVPKRSLDELIYRVFL